jgi:predicted alpha/beta hydrolase family esterase
MYTDLHVKTQIVIRYKWSERSEEKWLFWLKKKLEQLQCEVMMLPIAEKEFSFHKNWIEHIQSTHGINEQDTYFIEHDPGCLTILKYVERLVKVSKPESALLIAGFNLSQATQSDSTEVQLYRGQGDAKEDVRLVVLYGGTLGKSLKSAEHLFLQTEKK